MAQPSAKRIELAGDTGILPRRTARNWYWWLWLSPLVTVLSLVLLLAFFELFYDPGRALVCGGS